MDNLYNLNGFAHNFDHLPIVCYLLDRKGRIKYCNHFQARAFGLTSREPIYNLDIYEVGKLLDWPRKLPREIRRNDLKVMKSKQPVATEEIIEINGEPRIIFSMKSPWFDETNQVSGIFGVGVDITAEKRLEQDKQIQNILQERAEYLRVLAGNLAHNLRTPLAGVKVGLEVAEDSLAELIKGYELASEHNLINPMNNQKLNFLKKLLSAGKERIDATSQYIDSMLNTVNQERLDIKGYSYHSIAPLIEDCLSNYPFTPENKALIKSNLNDAFDFWGNAVYFKTMFNNLMKNAFHYIEQRKHGEIFIWLKRTHKMNQLYFKDTAQGISAEVMPHIFESYYSTSSGGSGLGLAFCKAVMQSFKGSVEVESIENHHVTFIFNFPKQVDSITRLTSIDKESSDAFEKTTK
ncbi:MAG: hypothetical protein Tsb005_21160 [Gammaproteobacteria bacterium]